MLTYGTMSSYLQPSTVHVYNGIMVEIDKADQNTPPYRITMTLRAKWWLLLIRHRIVTGDFYHQKHHH